jgi:hypothetical protein
LGNEGIVEEIIAARIVGVTHCGLSSQPSPSISHIAREFGLDDDPAKYSKIDTETAQRLITLILSQDLAYDLEIIPIDQASDLSYRFLAEFRNEPVEYFTNGTFRLGLDHITWNPVTNATFDTGVLIVGPGRSGCLWVEDEDKLITYRCNFSSI